MAGCDTDFEYKSSNSGSSKNYVSTYSSQDFKSNETQSTDNESCRDLQLQITGHMVVEQDSNQMDVDDGNKTIDHVQKQIIQVGLNKTPVIIVDTATGDSPVPGPLLLTQHSVRIVEIRTTEEVAKFAVARPQWREEKKVLSESKGVSGSVKKKKLPKSPAQRQREFRQRRKLAKMKMLLKQQRDQGLDALVSRLSSSQVNQRSGSSTINSTSAEVTKRGNFLSHQQIETSERTREYRERRNDIKTEFNTPSANHEEQTDFCNSTLTLKYDDITKLVVSSWLKNDLKTQSDNCEDSLKKTTVQSPFGIEVQSHFIKQENTLDVANNKIVQIKKEVEVDEYDALRHESLDGRNIKTEISEYLAEPSCSYSDIGFSLSESNSRLVIKSEQSDFDLE